MNVRYQWSEDGPVETVKKEDILLTEETPCYHCGTPIATGEAVELTAADGNVYILHPQCAEKSCF